MLRGPRRDVPELSDILQREMHRFPRGEQAIDAAHCDLMMGMVRLRSAQQHIGIDENAHPRSA